MTIPSTPFDRLDITADREQLLGALRFCAVGGSTKVIPILGNVKLLAAEERLHEIDVTVNRNTIPFDERSPFVTSGIRLGSPAMTMRGFDEDDFREVGAIICEALTESPDLDGLRARVAALCAKRPLYEGFRGYTTYVA